MPVRHETAKHRYNSLRWRDFFTILSGDTLQSIILNQVKGDYKQRCKNNLLNRNFMKCVGKSRIPLKQCLSIQVRSDWRRLYKTNHALFIIGSRYSQETKNNYLYLVYATYYGQYYLWLSYYVSRDWVRSPRKYRI